LNYTSTPTRSPLHNIVSAYPLQVTWLVFGMNPFRFSAKTSTVLAQVLVVFLSHSSIMVEQYINYAAFHLQVFPPFSTIRVTCFLLIFWDTDSVIKAHINKLLNKELHNRKVLKYNLVVYGTVSLLTAISWTPCHSYFLSERLRVQVKKMNFANFKIIGIYLPGAGFQNPTYSNFSSHLSLKLKY
jgi:hypothetical protein